jgi:hypothetical protein
MTLFLARYGGQIVSEPKRHNAETHARDEVHWHRRAYAFRTITRSVAAFALARGTTSEEELATFARALARAITAGHLEYGRLPRQENKKGS